MNKPLLFIVFVITVFVIVAVAILAFNYSPSSLSPTSTSSVTPLTSSSPKPTPSSSLNITEVVMKDNYYSPANLTITVGKTVQWTNNGGDIHTSTSYAKGPGGTGYLWNSGILNPGQSYSYTFTQTGTYDYFCGVHSDTMFGEVIVIPKT